MSALDSRLPRALALASALGEDHLGSGYFEHLLLPLLDHWEHLSEAADMVAAAGGLVEAREPLVISLSGWPGTGKSTFARLVGVLSGPLLGRSSVSLSLDDVYLTQNERAALARTTHPLLATRGVPGTHDLGLFEDTLEALMNAGPGAEIFLPRFDKLNDERMARETWPLVRGKPDWILLDGWFWGTEPGSKESLHEPLNEREQIEDRDGRYRAHVHEALSKYQSLFRRSSEHVHFEAPSFEASVRFRIEQGRRELERRGRDPAELDSLRTRRFLALFERVATWPRWSRPEWTVKLDDEHRVLSLCRGG